MFFISKNYLSSGLLIGLMVIYIIINVGCFTDTNLDRTQKNGKESSSFRPDKIPLYYGPKSETGYQAILATSDLSLGDNRFGFVITTPSGFLTLPKVQIKVWLTGSRKETLKSDEAIFQKWPYGNRGLYTTILNFDHIGEWQADIDILSIEDGHTKISLNFNVDRTTDAPNVGDIAIPSSNRTIEDVVDIKELTTGSLRDKDLYAITIANSLESNIPSVVVFASPAFCLNAVCGPQVEVLQSLKTTFGEGASFIHIDFYDNPREIQGDLTRAIISPTVREWGLPSSEWTFMIDEHGRVTNRFEGFANYNELANELATLLRVQPR